jgi:transcriptional regulator with XRE-family HTH domain
MAAAASSAAESFGALLRSYRERARLSQSALARQAGLDASFVNRVESGQRGAEREPVEALIGALQLPSEEADRLLAAAGHLPALFVRVGLHDATLQLVARVLTDESLSAAERADFRRIVAQLGARDPTLQLVAGILADEGLSARDRDEFRQIIALLGRRWRHETAGR